MAVEHGTVEVILFSLNPAYDLLPPTEEIDDYLVDEYDASLAGIDPERADLYKLCEQKGVALTVMKGFGGGRLLDAKRSPFGVALTPVQCLHYALTRPAVASVLIGFDNPEQVPASIAYETATDTERDYATVLANAPRHAYSSECTYCGHCKPCPMDIDIAMVNKLYDLATMQEDVPASVKAHYADLSAHASDCIACGACESRCPFGVPVTERMKRTAELLE
jgi:predicted aldo/keto reductase-like oxidoreductase